MTTENLLTILTSSLGIGTLVFFGLRNFFSEKFKNIATLQDIGKITHEIESVKKIFQDGAEKLKQELSVLTNKQNILFTEEKEALYIYFSAWNVWIGNVEKMEVNFLTREYNNIVDLTKNYNDMIKERNSEYNKILMSMSKIELFLKNEEIIQAIYKLNNETYKYQTLHENFAEKRMWNSLTFNATFERLDKIIGEGASEGRRKAEEDMLNEQTEGHKINKDFNEAKQLEFDEVNKAKRNFIILSRNYIRKDISSIS